MVTAQATPTHSTGVAERELAIAALRQSAPKLRALGIARLSLFGSMARGEVGSKSDIDLLVEVDPESHFTLFELLDLQDDLKALLGRPAHFAFASKLRPWLRDEIREEAISIY